MIKEKILFLTPYKHLKKFSKKVEKNYIVIDASQLSFNEIKNLCKLQNPEYIFSAPNYQKFKISDELKNSNLKAILSPSTGTNHIQTKKVKIISLKNDSILNKIHSTAEHNLYLILFLSKVASVPPIELSNLTISIIGYGRLGKMVENLCSPLFKKVYKCDINFVEDGFFDSDFLSINMDLNEKNYNFIDKKFIKKFKKNIFVVNTARGELVKEDDIIELLKSGKISGYATDVLKNEHDYKNDSILKKTKLKNLYITPHTGGTSIYAQELAYNKILEKIKNK